jgi:8-oxo-dGTP pyrophosphatase MutT (NUDIX family)
MTDPAPAPGPARWELRGERVVTATRVLDVLERRYHHPRRDLDREFVVLRAPDWVNVLALTADGRLVLVRQFRFGVDDFSLEIPGGVIEAGEDPVTAGVRELREETGYAGERARLIGSVQPNPAIQDNRCHFVLVEDARLVDPVEWDDDEEIAVSTAAVGDALAWARAGRISHGLVVAALFHLEPIWLSRQTGPTGARGV